MRALSGCGTGAFVVAVVIGWQAGVLVGGLSWLAMVSLWLTGIALVAWREHSYRSGLILSFMHLLSIEAGVVLFVAAGGASLEWAVPVFGLLPVATSPVWTSPRTFAAAMASAVLYPALLFALVPSSYDLTVRGVLFLGIGVSAAFVIHAYFVRILRAHFALEMELRAQAHTDALTGVWTRRHFTHLATEAIARARAHEAPVCALYLDVDRFKAINDTYGHATGDRALSMVAHVLRGNVRPCDIMGRLGGDEFAVVLPGATLAVASKVAERVRAAMSSVPVLTDDLCVSIGVAQLRADGDLGRLLAEADVALISAKDGGRNRVVRSVA